MKVSIITVVFNAESTIKDCIESVINQSYNDIEYIIIDGQSTDKTIEIIENYGTKIAVFVSEKDNGIYDAMNKGIARATGDVIGILNADDFYSNHLVVEKIVAKLIETQADGLYGDLVYVNGQNTKQVQRYWKSGEFVRDKFLYGWMPPHPTFFLKRTIYRTLGNYRMDVGSAADYELMLRMLYKNNINVVHLAEITTIMRTGGVSNKTVGNRLKANQNDRKAWLINEIEPYWFTLYLKPIRKISQFVYKPKQPYNK